MDETSQIKYCNERREQDRREQDRRDTEVRDRLTRVEQDVINHRDNFKAFKSEDFGDLKKEVHSMRTELNTKIDELQDMVARINLNLAKWMGAFGVALFVGEMALKYIFKI